MRGPAKLPASNKATIGAKPIIAVTDRSKAPAMIRIVMPAAPIPRIDASLSTAWMLPALKKLGAQQNKKIKIIILRIQTPAPVSPYADMGAELRQSLSNDSVSNALDKIDPPF